MLNLLPHDSSPEHNTADPDSVISPALPPADPDSVCLAHPMADPDSVISTADHDSIIPTADADTVSSLALPTADPNSVISPALPTIDAELLTSIGDKGISRSRSSTRCTPVGQKRSLSLPTRPCKSRKIRKDGQPNQTPFTAEDYKPYTDVLPSAKSISQQKLRLATQCELDAATALIDIQAGTKASLHYDTTSRCGIDGEWVSLILAFSDGRRFRFRPLFFAYEDRANIARYIVESYERLSVVCSEVKHAVVTATDLWNKTDNLMTDAVSKNLNVEIGVSEILNTDHVPKHLLCKSHTVEGLDRSNIAVLTEVERAINLKDKIEAINPGLKSFTRGGGCVILNGIRSILNLISHEKSASPTNIAHLFDVVCEREGATKHMSLYQERRFAKLGYLAGSILDAMPLLTMLLNECPNKNLHTESVRIFIECEFFSTALAVLSYFSYNVSFPLLYCVEISTQSELCAVLPKLYEDLLVGDTDTLSRYVVQRHQYQVKELNSELEKLLLKKFCTAAAQVVKLQCGREYFPSETAPPRATQIFALTEEEREGLPTNNLLPERDFSVFDRLSKVAKMANRKFRATNIRNDMTLLHQNPKLTDAAKRVIPRLAEREASWTAQQLELQTLNDEKKLQKARNVYSLQNKALANCKTWGGPCVSEADLDVALQRADDEMFCVTQELTFYKLTHPTEFSSNRQRFRVRGITFEEKVENLRHVLSNEEDMDANRHEKGQLPTNRDVLASLINDPVQPAHEIANPPRPPHPFEILNNCIVAVVWLVNDTRTWFLGCVTEYSQEDPDVAMVDHLERATQGSNEYWRYPRVADLCEIEIKQVIGIEPKYEWEIHSRIQRLKLRNHSLVAENVKTVSLN